MQISSVVWGLNPICYGYNCERLPFISNKVWILDTDLLVWLYRSHSSPTSFSRMWRAYSLMPSVILPVPFAYFLTVMESSGSAIKALWPCSQSYPKSLRGTTFLFSPYTKLTLTHRGEKLQRVLTKETMAGFVRLKIGNRSFPVEMPWDFMCEMASETVGDEDERSSCWD